MLAVHTASWKLGLLSIHLKDSEGHKHGCRVIDTEEDECARPLLRWMGSNGSDVCPRLAIDRSLLQDYRGILCAHSERLAIVWALVSPEVWPVRQKLWREAKVPSFYSIPRLREIVNVLIPAALWVQSRTLVIHCRRIVLAQVRHFLRKLWIRSRAVENQFRYGVHVDVRIAGEKAIQKQILQSACHSRHHWVYTTDCTRLPVRMARVPQQVESEVPQPVSPKQNEHRVDIRFVPGHAAREQQGREGAASGFT